MNTIQKLKISAHRAIIQYIKDHLIDIQYIKVDDLFVENKSEYAYRRQILNLLKKYGYPQFIISNDKEDFFPEPSFEVKRGDRESWHSYLVFNVNEIQEFLNYISNTQTPLELIKEIYECESYYGGAGRPFRNGNCVFQKRNRIIVEMSGGLDV